MTFCATEVTAVREITCTDKQAAEHWENAKKHIICKK